MDIRAYFQGEKVNASVKWVADTLRNCRSKPRGHAFASDVVTFLDEFGRSLMRDSITKQFPELVSLGFFLRKASIDALCRDYLVSAERGSARLQPRGIVFHVPPSNVDVIFVYSWVFAMLQGNHNVVRIPSSNSPALENILRVYLEAFKKAPISTVENIFIQYGRLDSYNRVLSWECDQRVIWGGDQSISSIRNFPLRPKSFDITFADRESMAVFKSNHVMQKTEDELKELARKFYNDSYLFNQKACSSPRTLFWVDQSDKQNNEASSRFLVCLSEVVKEKEYSLEAGHFLQKQDYFFSLVASADDVKVQKYSNELVVVRGDSTVRNGDIEYCGMGLFFVQFLDTLGEISELVTESTQTLVCEGFGLEELSMLRGLIGGRGVDRMVPAGEALSFSRFWDGYDLLTVFSKWSTVR